MTIEGESMDEIKGKLNLKGALHQSQVISPHETGVSSMVSVSIQEENENS